MEHFVAVMFLVGCGADGSACQEIPAPAPFYSSVQDCERDLSLQMRMTGTLDRKILGTCAPVDPALLEASATIDWAVSRSGQLMVEIKADEPVVAALDEIGSGAVQVASR